MVLYLPSGSGVKVNSIEDACAELCRRNPKIGGVSMSPANAHGYVTAYEADSDGSPIKRNRLGTIGLYQNL